MTMNRKKEEHGQITRERIRERYVGKSSTKCQHILKY